MVLSIGYEVCFALILTYANNSTAPKMQAIITAGTVNAVMKFVWLIVPPTVSYSNPLPHTRVMKDNENVRVSRAIVAVDICFILLHQYLMGEVVIY